MTLCMVAVVFAWLLTLASAESLYARHAPNRYDRRADRETRIPYSRSPAQPNPRRTIIIHSAPNIPAAPSTPEASPTATDANSTPESDSSPVPSAD